MLQTLIKKFRKPLTLEYINNYLRSKGIATNEVSETYIMFRLYDRNWVLYFEKNHLAIRYYISFDDGLDIQCLLKTNNKFNQDRWIIKSITEIVLQEDNKSINTTDSSIIFAFEGFCYTREDFVNLYEKAIYLISDAIDYHSKVYKDFLDERNKKHPQVGFTTHQNSEIVVS